MSNYAKRELCYATYGEHLDVPHYHDRPKFHVEDEETGDVCGHDYESFTDGFYCESLAVKAIVEHGDFHFAHLCDTHTDIVMRSLVG